MTETTDWNAKTIAEFRDLRFAGLDVGVKARR
jgi:hypothetical protein